MNIRVIAGAGLVLVLAASVYADWTPSQGVRIQINASPILPRMAPLKLAVPFRGTPGNVANGGAELIPTEIKGSAIPIPTDCGNARIILLKR